jgi:hypothetical protein
MQTFLPVHDFELSAMLLDWKRLGKQRVEAQQILNALLAGGAWSNHPATRMWAGYEIALIEYKNAMIREWIRRGYKNTMEIIEVKDFKLPPWFGDEKFHASHRSNLLRKDPIFYGQYGWEEGPDLEYVWPV